MLGVWEFSLQWDKGFAGDVFSDNICSVEALFKETKKGHLLFMIFIGIEGHAVQGYMELHSFM